MNQSFFDQNDNSRLAKLGNNLIKTKNNYAQVKRNRYDNAIRSKTQIPAGDSLQSFQSELDSIISRKQPYIIKNKPKQKKSKIPSKNIQQIDSLKSQLDQIRRLLDEQKVSSKQNPTQQKIQKLLSEISSKKQLSLNSQIPISYNHMHTSPYYQQPPIQQGTSPQSYPFFYPFPMPYPNQYPPPMKSRRHRRKYQYSDSESSSDSSQESPKKKRNPPLKKTNKRNNFYEPRRDKLLKKLRIAAYAVAFTKFIKSQTKKLSANRKKNMKRFLTDKFDSQMNHLKNWLLDAFKYSLSIILEKGQLVFKLNIPQKNKFGGTKISTHKSFSSHRVKSEKQNLLMQIIHIGLSKLLQDSNPQKISMFVQAIVYICRKNSYALGRFWTAYQMQQLCISQDYGFIRMDQSLQKYLIGLLIFIKVLVFNMFLQPYKFDVENFPRDKQPLSSNMMYIGSILYHIAKQIIQSYKDKQRNSKIYKAGNWLAVSNQFISECCQPMVYGRTVPQQKQYISGLYGNSQFTQLRSHKYWQGCKQKIEIIIDKVHKEMFNKAKLMRKNLKYKLYN